VTTARHAASEEQGTALRILAFQRAASAAREHQRVGPFLVRLTPGTKHPMLNYAVPDDGAVPSPDDVDDLEVAFERRGLTPRLEYPHAAAPGLEAVLLGCGFGLERRLPVMACIPSTAPARYVAPGFSVTVVDSDRDHVAAIVVADEAYGELGDPPDAAAVAARRRLSAEGGAVVLAREAASGEPAGSGMYPVPRSGVSELAGIGTKPAFRNRGVASSVVGALVELAARRGLELLWLTPEDEQAERIYTRSGFSRSGVVMVHISAPRA